MSRWLVYFDVVKYNELNNYGKLSGRNIDDILTNTRDLDGQSDDIIGRLCAVEACLTEHITMASQWERFPRVALGVFCYEY